LNNLGEIACALKDRDTARGCFIEALKIAAEAQIITVLLKVLVNLAECFARHGKPDRAGMLLGVAHRHPACEQSDREKAERLLNEVSLVPPDSTPRSLEAVVAKVLAEISP
jgi:hypothetical protein